MPSYFDSLVVKASCSSVRGRGSDHSQVLSVNQELVLQWPPHDARRDKISARTGWPDVSML